MPNMVHVRAPQPLARAQMTKNAEQAHETIGPMPRVCSSLAMVTMVIEVALARAMVIGVVVVEMALEVVVGTGRRLGKSGEISGR